jgi:hypothetical protein
MALAGEKCMPSIPLPPHQSLQLRIVYLHCTNVLALTLSFEADQRAKLLVYRLSMDVRARVRRALQARRTVGKKRLTHHH